MAAPLALHSGAAPGTQRPGRRAGGGVAPAHLAARPAPARVQGTRRGLLAGAWGATSYKVTIQMPDGSEQVSCRVQRGRAGGRRAPGRAGCALLGRHTEKTPPADHRCPLGHVYSGW